jgi:hypothetical protein
MCSWDRPQYTVVNKLNMPKNSNKSAVRRFTRRNRISGIFARNITPPSLMGTPQLTHRFRFQSTTSTPNTLVAGVHLFAFMGVATSNSIHASIFNMARLERVEAWSPGTSGSPVTMKLQAGQGDFVQGNSRIMQDTSQDPSRPAHCMYRPKGTAYRYVSPAETDALFYISSNASICVDITVTFTFTDDSQVTNVTTGTTGLSTGEVYYGNADGAIGVGVLKPTCGQTWN